MSKKFIASLDDFEQSYIPNWSVCNANTEKAIDLGIVKSYYVDNASKN